MNTTKRLSLMLFTALLRVLLVLWGSSITVYAQQALFSIHKGDDVVGSILASRSMAGHLTSYKMTSHSEFDMLWKQVVLFTMATDYESGSVRSCGSFMSVNGTMRDSSSMANSGGDAMCYVHPGRNFKHSGTVEWTTARMYFEEPVKERTIFVESLLQYCPLQRTGTNSYRLVLSNSKVNHYFYESGVLREIRVERTFFDLVFRRA